MANTVIRVENISKKYQLGSIGTGTIARDMNRWWARIRGKEDPTLKIGENGDREGEHWALSDVSFEIKQGEAVGIIGKNGAGKSTLLKILSRTTTPTCGNIKIKGRIASLLEVGTGFHPDLTGRENVFMNGAILGMHKTEIKAKFDEIVAFSGVEKYIDTPVKRYSSGMYVRLAFAVAAHLESEILILDEVLAVGDAEFQKKCLGKMGEVSAKEGRTVLFVSHNITAVKSLCNKGIMLSAGRVLRSGDAEEVATFYLQKSVIIDTEKAWNDPESAPGNEYVRLKSAKVVDRSSSDIINVHSPLDIEFQFWNYMDNVNINFSVVLYTSEDVLILNTVSPKRIYPLGVVKGIWHIPANFLNDSTYRVRLFIVKDGRVIFEDSSILAFEVAEGKREGVWHGKWVGVVRPKFDWDLEYVYVSEQYMNSVKSV